MVVNIVLLFGLVPYVELDKILAQIVTTVVVAFINYLLIKIIVFK